MVFGIFVFLFMIFMFILKLWIKATTGVCSSNKRMDGKTVIITGANAGIGKETAIQLARRGARVILACRDVQRGKEAQDEIIKLTQNENVVLHQVDLSSLKSVRDFAQTINKTENRLDVLINNAGSGGLPYKKTEDGLDLQMQTNYFGPFLLTLLLLGLLQKSAPSRILILSSVLHHFSTLNIDKINDKKFFHKMMAYNDSKFANLLWSNELARKLSGSGVTCNSLHPGVVLTNIWRHSFLARILMKILLRTFLKDINQGVQTIIYLAVSDEVNGVTGKYFSDCKETSTSKSAKDEGLAKKLWEKTEELLKLQTSDKLYL